MTSSNKDKAVFRYLLMKSLDGQITPSETQQLNDLLKTYPDIEKDYFDNVLLQFLLPEVRIAVDSELDAASALSTEFWTTLAEYEKTAPEVEIPQEKPMRELVRKVVYPPREKHKISKFNVLTLAASAAAVLFIVLFARFAPPKSGIEVATLTDSINAKWADVAGSMENGTRLTTRSDELFLREGLAELVFDNRTKVVIEGPAEFGLLAEDRIDLRHGRIYATVPRQAIGFTVSTPTSRIIDLGTEFGVQADAFGDVQLHVIKGKTTLIAGGRSNRVNLEVTEGQAKQVSGTTQNVSDIPCGTNLFVRDIKSDHKYVWRGQKTLDLAEMVGGGTGLGTGRTNIWVNLKTGEEGTGLIVNPQLQSQFSKKELGDMEKRTTDNSYKKVSHLPYIDGIFSPDGGMGDVQVSSKGHIWSDCPDTSGIYYEDIFTGSYITTTHAHYLILDNMMYGTKDRPAIALHSNAGITFDLDAIRRDMSHLKIVQFKAICGVSQEAGSKGNKEAVSKGNKEDFWVLVDGQKRFEAIGLSFDSGPREVTIPLIAQDRYLTLVSTDGDLKPNNDWGFFAMPRLEIENAQ